MLKTGAQLPNLTLKNQRGEPVRLHDSKGKNALVVYFYPKDYTPGCISEACGFRDAYQQFEALNATVLGISGDSERTHLRFSTDYDLCFDLLSDQQRQAQKAFGVPRNLMGLLPGRVTFVFNRDGILIYSFNSALNPGKHIREALKALNETDRQTSN